jgi:molybdate-binding protein/DNA-binding XRE family transcriptional regulator
MLRQCNGWRELPGPEAAHPARLWRVLHDNVLNVDMIVSAVSRPAVAEFRARHGWSQADLAARSGVSRTEISAIETGRVMPSVVVALRLATTLGESVERIFGGSSSAPVIPWAWVPASAGDSRAWRATVNGKVLAYPVEATSAGLIPHDAMVSGQDLQVVSDARPDRTLVMAGCDPLAGLLVHEMAERHGVRVLALPRASGTALELLKTGVVHVAGLHWTNDEDAGANDRLVKARLGAGYALLHQVRWDAGIAVSAQRPEHHVRDLLRANVRWVNREEGSAARRAFDRLLGRRRRPDGYSQIVRDHRAVAAAVSQGWADAGICMRAVAAEARVSFLRLHGEAYELCVAESLLDEPRIVALSAVLRSQRYRQWIGDVPGCLARDTSVQRMVR